jgi:hypothetical protein
LFALRRLRTPSFAVALAALVVALGGTAAAEIAGSSASTTSRSRRRRDRSCRWTSSGARIFVESTRLLPFGENKITPFLTNVSFDVAAIC